MATGIERSAADSSSVDTSLDEQQSESWRCETRDDRLPDSLREALDCRAMRPDSSARVAVIGLNDSRSTAHTARHTAEGPAISSTDAASADRRSSTRTFERLNGFRVPLSPPVSSSTTGTSSRGSKSSSGAKTFQRTVSQEEPSSSMQDIEFDGTTVLCRVCGDKASGFHYGVHSCEGCKGFFRRSIQQKIQYRPCTKNQQCSILRINRNRCQYCRLKKCISVGMSRDAVRFGRVPKREKAKILAAMQSVNARSTQQALTAELAEESRVLNSIIAAHMDTCDFTKSKMEALLDAAKRQPDYLSCPQSLACPLNPTNAHQVNGQQQLLQDFSERFSPAIRGVVEFAKRLPGFSLLAQDDQVTLLKAGVFEVLLVRLASMFDSVNNTMLCLNGQFLRRDSLNQSSNARFLMDSMFEFAERFNQLGLSDTEIALFCAVVVISADRPGLRNTEMVQCIQSKLKMLLDGSLAQSHADNPSLFSELLRIIPDLRTLNTLHSEKSLAFKMTEHQGSFRMQQYINRPSSPWTDSCEDDSARSPVGSVSGDSVCSAEIAMSDLPLLAAVAGSAAPLVTATRRRIRKIIRSDHGSTSSDGEDGDSAKICPFGFRKLDSADDSGIESGLDRYEKLSTASRSTSTSLCSSPRSSLEEKVKEVEDVAMMSSPLRSSTVDDMPVLKRVLQAPPLFDTNSLMDEAYRSHPHKKFRAMQRREADEMPTPSQQRLAPCSALAAALSAPPLSSAFSSATASLTSTHSTLARSLMEGPKLSPEQQRHADLIVTNIMRGTSCLTQQQEQPTSSSTSWCRKTTPPMPIPMEVVESHSQPLNLSLKSPEASPARSASPPVNHALYFALHA